jgi:FlaA1/EpsC-like NDP-sugar epimerase
MMRLSNLTSRNALIAAHDALATALAVFASFYLRFEGGELFYDRLPLLLRILPYFIAFSVVVCYVFNLTTTKWRFISLPDALNILRAATVLTLGLLVLDYIFIFVAPNLSGTFFLGRVTIVLYWFLEVFFLSALRFAYRYFRYTRVRRHARTEGASPTLLIGRAADGRPWPVNPQYSGARRNRRHRGCHSRFCRAR